MRYFYKSKRIITSLFLLMILLFCVSCGQSNSSAAGKSTNTIKVYYVNKDETAIISEDYALQSDPADSNAVIQELLKQMETIPVKLEYEAPITGKVHLQKFSLKDEILTLSFDDEYKNIEHTTEILDRAAMVRTLSQVEGEYDMFRVMLIRANPDTPRLVLDAATLDALKCQPGDTVRLVRLCPEEKKS